MEAQLQIINEGGIVQIDHGYLNHMFQGLIAVPCTTQYGISGGGDTNYYAAVDIAGDPQTLMVAAVDSSFCFVIPIGVPSPGVVRYNVVRYGGQGTVYLAAFKIGPPPSSTFGLQIFRGDSSLVFDAAAPAMRIIDFITSPETVDRGYSPSKVGIVNLSPSYAFTATPIGINTGRYLYSERALLAQSSGASISIAPRIMRTVTYEVAAYQPQPYPNTAGGNQAFLVVDMSGIV